jgi:hypothetical protein
MPCVRAPTVVIRRCEGSLVGQRPLTPRPVHAAALRICGAEEVALARLLSRSAPLTAPPLHQLIPAPRREPVRPAACRRRPRTHQDYCHPAAIPAHFALSALRGIHSEHSPSFLDHPPHMYTCLLTFVYHTSSSSEYHARCREPVRSIIVHVFPARTRPMPHWTVVRSTRPSPPIFE